MIKVMAKRSLLYTAIFIIVLAGFGYFYFVKAFESTGSTVTVTADNNCSKENVKVEFGLSVNTISRKNDLDLFINRSKYTVVYDGASSRKVPIDFGENDFLITYGDKYYLSFRHFIEFDFKSDLPSDHSYSFHFSRKDKQLQVTVDITGADSMRFERPMNLISNAEFLCCNVPIDSTKTIYNMIELE
jgi:hypothetical protein